jgi:hypothetical protein
MIDSTVHWCLNSNPSNQQLKKDTRSFSKTFYSTSKKPGVDMESQAAIETIPEVDEREKALEDTIKIMDDEKRKEEESKHF